MFVRTERLTLRPGWAEDAPELARAIGHESVVRNLARAPWPFPVEAAETFLSRFGNPIEPKFLILEHKQAEVRLIGVMSIEERQTSQHEFGYWLTPDAWGKGYATEAGRGVLRAARARGLRHIASGHFIDNPASGKVLRKLGFRPTGVIDRMFSRGRGCEVTNIRYAIDLAEGDNSHGVDPDARMAA